MKKIEDFINSKSRKIQAIGYVDICDEQYEKVIHSFAENYNLMLIEQLPKEYDYRYKGENYKKVSGVIERVKILTGELFKEKQYSYFRFRVKFIIDKIEQKININVYEYSPSTKNQLEENMIEIMKVFINDITHKYSK